MAYWFVGFTAFYNDVANRGVNICGDAVVRLPLDSFAPGVVKRLITKFVTEHTTETQHRPHGQPVAVFLGSITKIDASAFADYTVPSSELEAGAFGTVSFNEQSVQITVQTLV